MSKPTAANDNQNPGWLIAQGSTAVTTTAEASRHSGQGQRRPEARSSATLASIQTVRCAGTPQPENKAYNKAASTPAIRPTCGAGQARQQRALRRHSQATRPCVAQANMVT